MEELRCLVFFFHVVIFPFSFSLSLSPVSLLDSPLILVIFFPLLYLETP